MIVDISRAKDRKSELHGFILERTARRVKQYFQKQLSDQDTGITIDQWVILQVLADQDGLSQLEIAKAVFKDAPTVTRIIDLLCKKKLTKRIADAADRRRFKIKLTKQGHEKIEEVVPIIQEARQQTWKGIPDKDREQLVQTLNQVFDNLL
jgi:DNA-binding MarR family transcriptional regulator